LRSPFFDPLITKSFKKNYHMNLRILIIAGVLPLSIVGGAPHIAQSLQILQMQTENGGTQTMPVSALSPELQKQLQAIIAPYRQPTFAIDTLPPMVRYNTVSTLFNSHYSSVPLERSQASPSDQREYIIRYVSSMNAVRTTFGQVCVTHLLQDPRYSFLHSSKDDVSTRNVEISLQKLRSVEDALVSLWKEEPYAEGKAIASLSHPCSYLNKSVAWQECFTCMRHAKPLFTLSAIAAAACGGLYLAGKPFGFEPTEVHLRNAAICAGVTTTPWVAEDIENSHQFRKTLHYLHRKMNALAQASRTFDACALFVAQHPQLQTLPHASLFDKSVRKKFSPTLKKLRTLLATDTFTGTPTFFSRKGRVRAAYALFQEVRQEFITLLIAVGEVDACLRS